MAASRRVTRADDGAALVFRDEVLHDIVASRPAARALSRGTRTKRIRGRDRAGDALTLG